MWLFIPEGFYSIVTAEESAIDVILDGKSAGKTSPNPDGDLRPAAAPVAAPPVISKP